ncbi:predicted protein [Pyrenophora tritici-repentis Pt-1C-BFP]|uniref:Uncharacterized protein n=1 Tax=Pyrenophora tritici-repentis (strain Pt-1C-BFP) TaxID=426418 RepID=B2WPI1_PYRTR|nr:uncharacterized protein PTRG_11891 [Pyrenophora tritici-repentis Pt-1C-BFP]EDU46047.1 predicted protein [Pyrenophora tritici-repentis Pt-1C-BFP]
MGYPSSFCSACGYVSSKVRCIISCFSGANGIHRPDPSGFEGLQYEALCEGGYPGAPEEREEVPFLDWNKALSLMEMVSELVRVGLREWLEQHYIKRLERVS